MTFIADEKSRDSANPVELYKFEGNGATPEYFFTSGDRDFLFLGDTYIAVPMLRSDIIVPSDGEAPELSVTLPIRLPPAAELIQDYAFNIAPQDLSLLVTRVHVTTGFSNVLWQGEVDAITVVEREANLRVTDALSEVMQEKLPHIHYQPHCNNVLYDFSCTVVRATFLETTTVAVGGVSADGFQITVASMGARADGFANGGEIVRTSTGERRHILDHTGVVITINWPFSDIDPLDAVEVTGGCDHSLDDCHNKFGANTVNFIGMPYIPSQSVFSNNNGMKK